MMVQDCPQESVTELEMVESVSPLQQEESRLSGVLAGGSAPERFGLWKKGGRALSILLATNILLLGSCFIISGSIDRVAIEEKDVLAFLCTLMLLSILWMCVQIYLTHKHKNAVLYKDSHAGPIWLRGGLVVFGICTLLLDGFKIGHHLGHMSCTSNFMMIYPVIQGVFVIVQTYFLWVSSKHCLQIHHNVMRFGLMLILTTNLAVWMTTVTDESSHLSREMMETLNHTKKDELEFHSTDDETPTKGDCNCNYVCILLKKAYYYLYPFHLEYSLFACAMSYVMWKNVGRLIDDDVHHPHHLKLRSWREIPFIGLMCGITMLAVGLALFVVYELQLKDDQLRNRVLTTFFIFHVICLSLMSIGALGGIIVFKFDRRQMCNRKNPSRALDVALLFIATIGQYCISYYSIVAMVATNPIQRLRALTLTYSLLMIVQHTIQNIFIIEGLHRQLPNDWQPQHKAPPETPRKDSSTRDNTSHHASQQEPSTLNAISHHRASIRATLSTSLSTHKKRRRVLREICAFLLLGNILFWIIPAFGARLRFDSNLEVKFYGMSMWVHINNICYPFGIFYRMHAAACMVELSLQP
ncbi:proton channel OTOP2-like [Lissotriton helveticus]